MGRGLHGTVSAGHGVAGRQEEALLGPYQHVLYWPGEASSAPGATRRAGPLLSSA